MSQRSIKHIVTQIDAIIAERQTFHFRYLEHTRGWSPATNVYRYQGHYEICIELAGVTLEDIQFDCWDTGLQISGERHAPSVRCLSSQPQCHKTTLMEIREGRFQRTIELPEAIDSASATLSIDNGLVWISLKLLQERR